MRQFRMSTAFRTANTKASSSQISMLKKELTAKFGPTAVVVPDEEHGFIQVDLFVDADSWHAAEASATSGLIDALEGSGMVPTSDDVRHLLDNGTSELSLV